LVRQLALILAAHSASVATAQPLSLPTGKFASGEPQLQLGSNNFSMPVVEYRAPDGTIKRGSGIIIGHDIAPNATVGIGFFKLKPRYDDPAAPPTPSAVKSRKMSLGFSMRF
jgi:hypothetical protein